jgi:predicted ferric reductase
MFVRKYSPFFWVILSLSIFLVIWTLASFDDWKNNCWPLKGIGTSLGVAGYFFFSLSLLLSSRWRKLEDWIGGLDQIYHLHRHLGIWGFCLILLHPWIEAFKWLPKHLDKFFLFTFPVHGRLSVNIGSIAFWLMIIILSITLLKLLPYDKWKVLHKFMSVVFVLASFHILLSEKRFGSEIAQSLLLVPMAIGFFGIFYKQVFLPFFARYSLFKVINIKNINDNVVEVTLNVMGRAIKFTPGQYGFFSFDGPLLTKESHPFTLIETSDDSIIIILIKARGDFTKSLYQNIKTGYLARYEGPYGRFDYSHSGDSQIWIAGGIGIVPFLAWVRAIKNSETKLKIDLYYCIHRKEDAIFYEEFQEFSKTYPHFQCFLHCSEEDNRIDFKKILNSSEGIAGKKVLMCGPMKLTSDLKKQFQALGVKKEDIYFEDFEFF